MMEFEIKKEEKMPVQLESIGRKLDVALGRMVLAPYKKIVEEMEIEINALEVKDKDSSQRAVELGAGAAKLLRQIKANEEEICKTPKNFVKAIGFLTKDFKDSLDRIKKSADLKMQSYEAVRLQKQREQEKLMQDEAQKLQDKLNKDAEEKGIEAPIVPVPVFDEEPGMIHTDMGSRHTRSHWAFEVLEPFEENIYKVPARLLQLNEKAVRAELKMTQTIPGLRIWEEKKGVFRS